MGSEMCIRDRHSKARFWMSFPTSQCETESAIQELRIWNRLFSCTANSTRNSWLPRVTKPAEAILSPLISYTCATEISPVTKEDVSGPATVGFDKKTGMLAQAEGLSYLGKVEESTPANFPSLVSVHFGWTRS